MSVPKPGAAPPATTIGVNDRAAREVPWALLSYAVNKGITLGTTIVLARLIAPRDFGLVALASLTIQTVSLFNDLGLGGALIVGRDLSSKALGTMLTLMVGMHVAISLVILATAPLMALAFDQPRLTGVLAALSATVALFGISWFQEALMQRELRFKRRFVAQLTQSATYAVVALALALGGAGVWSIVLGQIAGVSVYAVALFVLVPFHVRPAFDREEARSAFRNGRGFMAQGGLAFLAGNVDYFAVGRLLGAAPLGLYSMAYRLGELPYYAIADPVARVTFPTFSRMHERDEDLAPRFLTVLRLVALVACPLGILLSGAADPFIRAIFGSEWRPMLGALSVLGVWAAVRPVQVTVGWLLNSIGQAGLMGRISAIALVPLIAGVVLAATLGGITAVAWVMLADMTLSLVLLAVAVQRRAGIALTRQWEAVRPVALACVPSWLAARAGVAATAAEPPVLALIAAVAAGAAVYLAVVSLVAPGTLHFAVRRGREMIRPVAVADGS